MKEFSADEPTKNGIAIKKTVSMNENYNFSEVKLSSSDT